MYKQIVYIAAAMGYTFAMTAIIAKAFDLVPFLRLRADDASEKIGMDHADVRFLLFRTIFLLLGSILRHMLTTHG